MKLKTLIFIILLLSCAFRLFAQQSVGTANTTVPPLVNFSGVLTDVNGKSLTGVVGVTFYLYKEQEGGAPLWMETQNVHPDKSGRYTVMLGSTTSYGLPSDIFVAGEARWLGVQMQGQTEQPRVLLLSVPYALKAGDAETIGGLPPSAFVLAAQPSSGETASTTTAVSVVGSSSVPPPASTVTTNGGTANTISMFTGGTTIGNAIMTQTGTTAINVLGKLNLPNTGTATASKGFNSRPLDLNASSFNSGTAKAVTQTFQWQAEAAGNNTSTPSGTLNLLFGAGGATPAETGLTISNKGLFTFAPGQTFPGTGTIKGVTAGTDLTGGGSSGNVTLNVDTTKVAQLSAANTFTGNQTINGNLSLNNLTASSVIQGQLGSFTGSNAGNILIAQNQNTSGGIGIVGDSIGTGGVGVEGNAFGSGGTGVQGSGPTGVMGSSSAANGAGVIGQATGSPGIGVNGVGPATGTGVFGSSGGALPFIPKGVGVQGESFATNGTGVGGLSQSGTGVLGISSTVTGIWGTSVGSSNTERALGGCCPVGVWGDTSSSAAGAAGLVGTADQGQALFLQNSSTTQLTANINNVETTAHNVKIMNVQGAFGSCNADTDGDLTCTGRIKGNNVAAVASFSSAVDASSSDCLGALLSANSACDTPGLSLTETTGNVPVFIIANLGGVGLDGCVVANFALVMDGNIVAANNVTPKPSTTTGAFVTSVTLVSLQFPGSGSHTFEVQESDDTAVCSGSTQRTSVGFPSNSSSNFSTRTLIVREF